MQTQVPKLGLTLDGANIPFYLSYSEKQSVRTGGTSNFVILKFTIIFKHHFHEFCDFEVEKS